MDVAVTKSVQERPDGWEKWPLEMAADSVSEAVPVTRRALRMLR